MKVFASYLLTCITKCAMVWEFPLSLYNPFIHSAQQGFVYFRLILHGIVSEYEVATHSLTHSLALIVWMDEEILKLPFLLLSPYAVFPDVLIGQGGSWYDMLGSVDKCLYAAYTCHVMHAARARWL